MTISNIIISNIETQYDEVDIIDAFRKMGIATIGYLYFIKEDNSKKTKTAYATILKWFDSPQSKKFSRDIYTPQRKIHIDLYINRQYWVVTINNDENNTLPKINIDFDIISLNTQMDTLITIYNDAWEKTQTRKSNIYTL